MAPNKPKDISKLKDAVIADNTRGRVENTFAQELDESLGKPLKTLLSVFFGAQAPHEVIPEEKHEGVKVKKHEKFDHFYDNFIWGIFEKGGDAEKNAELQKQALRFQAGLSLNTLVASGRHGAVTEYLQKFGIERAEDLPRGEEVLERKGPLEKAVIKSLTPIGESKKGNALLFLGKNRGKADIRLLMGKIFELHEGIKSPANRKRIEGMTKEMLLEFGRETKPQIGRLKGNLLEFSETLEEARIAARIETLVVESDSRNIEEIMEQIGQKEEKDQKGVRDFLLAHSFENAQKLASLAKNWPAGEKEHMVNVIWDAAGKLAEKGGDLGRPFVRVFTAEKDGFALGETYIENKREEAYIKMAKEIESLATKYPGTLSNELVSELSSIASVPPEEMVTNLKTNVGPHPKGLKAWAIDRLKSLIKPALVFAQNIRTPKEALEAAVDIRNNINLATKVAKLLDGYESAVGELTMETQKLKIGLGFMEEMTKIALTAPKEDTATLKKNIAEMLAEINQEGLHVLEDNPEEWAEKARHILIPRNRKAIQKSAGILGPVGIETMLDENNQRFIYAARVMKDGLPEEAAEEMGKMIEQEMMLGDFLDKLATEIGSTYKAKKSEQAEAGSDEDFKRMRTMVEEAFERNAPELKKSLSRMYALKSLDTRRAFNLIRSAEGRTFVSQVGYDASTIFRKMANRYRAINKDSLEDRVKTAIEKNTDGTPVSDEELCNRLMNTHLGHKVALTVGLDTNIFKQAIGNIANEAIRKMMPGVDANSVDSFKKLIVHLMSNPEVNLAGKLGEILEKSNTTYANWKGKSASFWNSVNTLFGRHKEQRGHTHHKVKEIVMKLKGNPRYRTTIQLFDTLAHTIQGEFKSLQHKHPQYRNIETSMESCRRVYSMPDVGFGIRYSQNIPGVSPTACDFLTLKNKQQFDFDKLVALYAEGIADPALVDMEEEIKTQILEPLATLLGFAIDTDPRKNFATMPNSVKKDYLNEDDFKLSSELKKALSLLDGQNLDVKEKKEEPKKEKHDETDILSDAEKEEDMRDVKRARARVADLVKAEKRKEKEAAEREGKPPEKPAATPDSKKKEDKPKK